MKKEITALFLVGWFTYTWGVGMSTGEENPGY
jgi:hypothetical protein